MVWLFITFEGIDGSGKSTQASRLYEHLSNLLGKGMVLLTREPGGWSHGDMLRELLLHHEWRSWSEFFLFMADRYEHVHEQIMPVLSNGLTVICERYIDSTLAYQGWGRGLPVDEMKRLFSIMMLPVPDLTVWLDVPIKTAMDRIRSRKAPDRLEEEGFLCRVRHGYVKVFEEDPQRIKRVSSDRDKDVVFVEICKLVEAFMDESGKRR